MPTEPAPLAPPAGSDPPESYRSVVWRTVVEMARVILLSIAIILPVRYFLVQPFYVKGASMEPNFYDHEYLVIDELSYRFRPVARGEIVVFRPPTDGRQYFIKRVIGLPGETISVSGGGVTVEDAERPRGFKLSESAYLGGTNTPGEVRVKLGAGEYFLLGDNRGSSLDSRSFGPVPLTNIIGRVWVRGWPPPKIGVVSAVSYPKI